MHGVVQFYCPTLLHVCASVYSGVEQFAVVCAIVFALQYRSANANSNMQAQIRNIINEVYSDLEAACVESGEKLDAESLADCVGDRMIDCCEEYRNTPYNQRRSLVLQICREYC